MGNILQDFSTTVVVISTNGWENGLMAYRLENVPLAVHKEAKLLLFQGMQGFENLSCLDRVSAAQLTISLSTEEHNQTIPRQARPQTWHVIYADRYTCQEEELAGVQEDVGFQLTMLNPDSAGNPTDHFSAEEAGLHSFFFLLILAYFVASCIYMQPLWQALYKGGPMHTVLKVLSTALFLQGLSVLLNYIHMAKYARDGVGTPLMGNLAEFCDMVAQVQMLYMLLSLCMGWTLSRGRKSQIKPLQWDSSPTSTALAVGGVVTQQYGFMPRKSTTDAIFALRILMEKYRDGQKELHCVFVDLEKAYDRVPREELWYCMRKSGVAEKYVRVVQDMYERSRTVVRCAVGQTEEFNVEVGLHQGSALSPFLFAIVMDQLSEEVRQESPWTMMFADDIVICSESREQVEENLERWRFALERRGMKVSRSKTEYMCVNEREGSGTVRLQGEEVKKVQEFKYLGSTVQSNGECGKEVKKRVQAGWNGWRKVSGVLCDQKISARIKGKVYRTVVRPAMLYGLETVSLRKRQELELEGALLIWEQFEDTEHHSYHGYHSVPGLLLMVLRVSLTLVLASVLYQIISAERSTLKRDFYLSFAKVITIGVILCQSISVVILYRLFLSRSLYWEVSSLSSVTLPITMSRSQRGRY
ncbi:hypothetical protein QTP86_005143 [Hemibagrus guttatus]|nr:hypothetical protein QTP86_005143 [Hemibagrus guttatus]